MVGVILAATGLLFCPELVTPDGGIVQVQPAPQWMVGSSEFCTPRTVLSPDGSRTPSPPLSTPPAGQLSSDVSDEGGIRETTLIAPKPIASAGPFQCKATYRAKPIDVSFVNGRAELTPESQAALTGLLAEMPSGLSVIGYLPESSEKGESVTLLRSRMAGIRMLTEKLMVTMPSMTQEERVVSKKDGVLAMVRVLRVIGIFSNPCGERVLVRRQAPPGPLPTGVQVDHKGGVPVAP